MFEVFELISTWFDFCSLEYLKNYPQILLEKKKKKNPYTVNEKPGNIS